jgi:hypothetical protein
VRQLSEHYHKSPELITEQELRQYFLFIKNVKHYSRNTSTGAICGIKFFFEKTLNRDWATFGLLRAHIGIPRCSFLPKAVSTSSWQKPLSRCPKAACRTLFRVCRVATVKETRITVIQGNLAAWIAL